MEKASLLQDIDRKRTRKNVEDVLERIRLHKQMGFVRREMNVTSVYTPRFHGQTHTVGKPVESIAVSNVDKEKELDVLTAQVEQAVHQLSELEQAIIQKRYLEKEETFDYLIHDELGLAARTYGRIKARAFDKLAYMLRLEVMKGELA